MTFRIYKEASILIVVILFGISCHQATKEKIERYPTGGIKFIKRYNDKNELEGQAQWFYENGNIEQIVPFVNGRENGNAFYCYPSGALKNFRLWGKGKKISYGTDFYDDSIGIIKSTILFHEDSIVYRKNFNKRGEFINQEGPFK